MVPTRLSVGGVHGDALVREWQLAHMSQLLAGRREDELLAAEAADEAASPHEATVLQPAKGPLQVAPGKADRLLHDQVPEHGL